MTVVLRLSGKGGQKSIYKLQRLKRLYETTNATVLPLLTAAYPKTLVY